MNKKYLLFLAIFIFFTTAIYYKYILITNRSVNFVNHSHQEYLENLQKPLKIGITQIPNQVLVSNEKVYRGFSIDLFRKISEMLSIDFEYVYFNTWQELIKSAKDKKVDIIFLAQQNAKRMKYFNFTDTVLLQKNKIIIKAGSHKSYDLESDKNLRVSLSKGSAIVLYIKTNYPNIHIIEAKDEREALSLVANEKVDLTILEPVRASYYMKKYNIDNLIIYQDIKYDYQLKIASNNKLMIGDILQKSIANITDNYMQSLYLKWGYTSQNDEYLAQNTIFYMWFISIIGLFYTIYLYISNIIKKKITATLEEKISEAIKENTKQLQLLQQQTKMAQMGEMIGAIAHQWRQPLNTLSTSIQNLKYDYQDGYLNDEVFIKAFINKQKDTIKFMSTTIDDFRNFFRVDKAKKNFQIKEATQSVITMLSSQIYQNNIKLNIEADELEYYGLESEYQQVILNIINNAKDALVENNIKDPTINIIIKNNTISIQDNAGGIPKDILERIFEPYYTTKEQGKGTGMGLYMSKMIIEDNMGAKLSVSNSSHGAVFKIVL